MRSAMAAACPLFETQMLHIIATQCAGALIGGNNVLLLPSPCISYYILGQDSAPSRDSPSTEKNYSIVISLVKNTCAE